MVKDYLNYMKVKVQILSYNIEIRITIIKDLLFNYIILVFKMSFDK